MNYNITGVVDAVDVAHVEGAEVAVDVVAAADKMKE